MAKEINPIFVILGIVLAILFFRNSNLGLFSTFGSPPTLPMGIDGIIYQSDGTPYPVGTEVSFIYNGEPQEIQGKGDSQTLTTPGLFNMILLESKGFLSGKRVELYINGNPSGESLIYTRGEITTIVVHPNPATGLSGSVKNEAGLSIKDDNYDYKDIEVYLYFTGLSRDILVSRFGWEDVSSYKFPNSRGVNVLRKFPPGSYRLELSVENPSSVFYENVNFPSSSWQPSGNYLQNIALSSGSNSKNIIVNFNSDGKTTGNWVWGTEGSECGQSYDLVEPGIKYISEDNGRISYCIRRDPESSSLGLRTKCYFNNQLEFDNEWYQVAQMNDPNFAGAKYRIFSSGGASAMCRFSEAGTVKLEVYHWERGKWVLDLTKETEVTKPETTPEEYPDYDEIYDYEDNCGNGICDSDETIYSCSEDCGYCGDGICSNGEGEYFCPQDCDPDYDTSDVIDPGQSPELPDDDLDGFSNEEEILSGTDSLDEDSFPESESTMNNVLFKIGDFDVTLIHLIIALGLIFLIISMRK